MGFHELVGAHGHHVFAVFDDPSAGEEAVEALRFDGLAEDEGVGILRGAEGAERLDLTGRAHGLRATLLRMLQFALSSDVAYLRTLDEALRQGHTVLGVRVEDADAAREVGWLLRMYGGRSIAYNTHWDFIPIAA
jgi:hypothetical protein